MPSTDLSRQYPDTPISPDSALSGENAEHYAAHGAVGGDVSMGSDVDWCQEAAGRRSTSQGEPGDGARAPSKLDRPSGLVISRISAQRDPRRVTLEVGCRDIRIRRTTNYRSEPRRGGGPRSVISAFSNASKRRLLFTARNFPGAHIMLTLTYPTDFPADGRIVKAHWRRFRQWLIRQGADSGLWVLEFQRRGAPHFHLFISQSVDHEAVSNAWYRIVGSGDPKHLLAGTRIELFRNPMARGSYVMKYAAKIEQKAVPKQFHNVGRFWGTWGNPAISRTVTLPLHTAKSLVRLIRQAYQKQIKTWTYRNNLRRFRDNGRSGFIAWDTSYTVSRILDELFETGAVFHT